MVITDPPTALPLQTCTQLVQPFFVVAVIISQLHSCIFAQFNETCQQSRCYMVVRNLFFSQRLSLFNCNLMVYIFCLYMKSDSKDTVLDFVCTPHSCMTWVSVLSIFFILKYHKYFLLLLHFSVRSLEKKSPSGKL